MAPLAAILGLNGPKLSGSERAFFRDADPWAFILFKRNVEAPDQVRRLCDDLRASVGRDALIFIDQEGGRVQRLRPPHWRNYPSGSDYAALHRLDPARGRRAIWLGHRLIADDLRSIGITADCAPVLDLPQPGADPIISDRAFGRTIERIVDLAHAAMAGLMSGGVAPVIKHIPGHGRATVDSHKALPRISEDQSTLDGSDYEPFRRLRDAPMAMTAHAVFESCDNEPITHSSKAVKTIIRDLIGFDGLLMTDDLDMKALSGNSLKSKAERALDAGCDVALQCSGKLADMVETAKGCRPLSDDALRRAMIAQGCVQTPDTADRADLQAEFEAIPGMAA